VTESPDSHHKIEEYFSTAQSLLANVSHDLVAKFGKRFYKGKVFIASDDSDILPEARKK